MTQQELEDRIADLVTDAIQAGLSRGDISMALQNSLEEFMDEEER